MKKGQAVRLAAFLLALSAFLMPVSNPDLWWHLSAARKMAAEARIPNADFLSHTRFGRPWVDFEWLAQLVYLGVFNAAGFAGLIVLRVLLMAGVLACSAALMTLYGAGLYVQAAILLAEGCALFPYGDIRPDNFSTFFFSLLLLGLEAWRLGRLRLDVRRAALLAGALFALWSNLHLGLLYGLLLLGLYAAEAAARGWKDRVKILGAALGGALLGCLLNPRGAGLLLVLPEHTAYMDTLSNVICEWKSARFAIWWVWPYDVLLAASGAALAAALASSRRPPAALVLAWAFFAAASIAHERHMTYFAVFAAPVLCLFGHGRIKLGARTARLALAAAAAAPLAFLAVKILPINGGPRSVIPAEAFAGYLEANTDALGGLKLFNNWADGGYLGWKLAPRYRLFYDGRYLFHDLLEETHTAASTAAQWNAFMAKHDIELACMSRSPLRPSFDRPRRKQGGLAELRRPYYAAFMPRKAWALIYWDERQIVFARRDRVDARWLSAHEYAALWPDDSQRLAYLGEQGLVSHGALEAEAKRHAAESPASAEEGFGLAAWASGAR